MEFNKILATELNDDGSIRRMVFAGNREAAQSLARSIYPGQVHYVDLLTTFVGDGEAGPSPMAAFLESLSIDEEG